MAPAVVELHEIQKSLGLADNDFAKSVKLDYSGSSWGKIKSGTFSGSPTKALSAVKRALANYRTGGEVVVQDGKVIFDHIQAARDAVTIAAAAKDEHKLVVVSGCWGSGKSTLAEIIHAEFGGHYFHAKPSWEKSYFRSLVDIAAAIGLAQEFRSEGEAESVLLATLKASPCLLILDEANHFSRKLIDFWKAVLNETACALNCYTLPGHLARMAAIHSEQTRQFLRRAVAIIHIGQVSSADVMAIHSGLYPELHLGQAAPAIASCANRHYRMDTVIRIFDEANPEDADDLPRAVERVEKDIKTIMQA
ncbi:MAG: AAA family ATPase [Luteolibacter sp.]